MFQHTAARRRLGPISARTCINGDSFNTQPPEGGWFGCIRLSLPLPRFNTQPPEGGWIRATVYCVMRQGFNTQPPEGGWDTLCGRIPGSRRFNTQPPEGGWDYRGDNGDNKKWFQHTAARRRLA